MKSICMIFFNVILLFFSCAQPEEISEIDQNIKDPIRYLALGDSYTIGEGVAITSAFPNQLKDSLISRGFLIDTVAIIAKTGWTTDELQVAIDNISPAHDYNLVTLLIGVNNQFRRRSLEEFGTQFERLLKDAIAYVGHDTTRVFVLSIPDYGATPFGLNRDPSGQISAEIDAFNALKKEICLSYHVAFIDITEISRLAIDDLSLLATDNLHPSGKMYGQWVFKLLRDEKWILNE